MFVIRHKLFGHYFSNWIKDWDGAEIDVWNPHDPWKYGRMCDAQFVLAHMEWQDIAEVVEWKE